MNVSFNAQSFNVLNCNRKPRAQKSNSFAGINANPFKNPNFNKCDSVSFGCAKCSEQYSNIGLTKDIAGILIDAYDNDKFATATHIGAALGKDTEDVFVAINSNPLLATLWRHNMELMQGRELDEDERTYEMIDAAMDYLAECSGNYDIETISELIRVDEDTIYDIVSNNGYLMNKMVDIVEF